MEGKKPGVSQKELGVSSSQLQKYRQSDEYRNLALAYWEQSELGGINGVSRKFLDMLDAVKPHNKVIQLGGGRTRIEIEYVPDNRARLDALKKISDIYGLNAPSRKDVKVEVSMSSDDELFEAIGKAQTKRKHIDCYQQEGGRYELIEGESGSGQGDFTSRERAVLQDDALPEPL